MGNKESSTQKNSAQRRPSAVDREIHRQQKRTILECLEVAAVPLETQDQTCNLLLDGGICTIDQLRAASKAKLEMLGVKPSDCELILRGRDRYDLLAKKQRASVSFNSTSSGPKVSTDGLPPVLAQRKGSIAARRKSQAGRAAQPRLTKFIKGDIVEHYRESDSLIRKGRVMAVHTDDSATGIYYTIQLLDDIYEGREVQSTELKLEFPGVWEKTLLERGITPIHNEGDAQRTDDSKNTSAHNEDTEKTNDYDLL